MSRRTHINRNNYELWFIDYIEGMLSPEENKSLQAFLYQHPDLATELENLNEAKLPTPEIIPFPRKIYLKKAPKPFSKLSLYDYQMVKALEEGLSCPEGITKSSVEQQTDWTLYKKTKLHATQFSYPHKEKLKHKTRTLFPTIIKGVAAAILFLVLFNINNDEPVTSNNVKLASTTSVNQKINYVPEIRVIDSLNPKTSNKISQPKKTNSDNIIITREVTPTLPSPKMPNLPTPNLPNSYEIGLQLMMPKYIENHRLIASASNIQSSLLSESDTKTFLNLSKILINQVSPFNLTYKKIYDKEGELVAINLSGNNFEVAQKIPKWWNSK